MSVALADMIGTYTVTEAQLTTCLQAAGIRCDSILNALAPLETTPNTVPTPISEYGGTYTVDTAAKRDSILTVAAVRAQSFWQQFINFKV